MSQATTHHHMLESTYLSHTDHGAHTGTHTTTAHTPHTTQDGLPQFMTHHTGDHPTTTIDIDTAAITAATHHILMPGTELMSDQPDILMSHFIPHQ